MNLLNRLLSKLSRDRRSSPRFYRQFACTLLTESKESLLIILEDISKEGARICSESSLHREALYVLRLQAPRSRFQFGLKLVWTKRNTDGTFTHGVRFVGPGSQNSSPFLNFLKELSNRERRVDGVRRFRPQ